MREMSRIRSVERRGAPWSAVERRGARGAPHASCVSQFVVEVSFAVAEEWSVSLVATFWFGGEWQRDLRGALRDRVGFGASVCSLAMLESPRGRA